FQERMIDVAERFLRHVGYDDGAFNVEFMWDREADKLWLIEVNTRISQSHSELFLLGDGSSNHEVAIDVALGEPTQVPHRQGRNAVGALCHLICRGVCVVVRRVPSEEDLEALDRAFPGARATFQGGAGGPALRS